MSMRRKNLVNSSQCVDNRLHFVAVVLKLVTCVHRCCSFLHVYMRIVYNRGEIEHIFVMAFVCSLEMV